MTKLIRLLLIIVIVLQISISAQTSEPVKDSRFYERLAYKAYQEKNYATFLENLQAADRILPNHPRITYNLSIAYAKNDRAREALDLLSKLSAMKLYYQIEKNEDFAPLRENAEFQMIAKKMTANLEPTGNARREISVAEKGLVPESVAFDEKTASFYLSSVAQRKILRVDKTGRTTIFADKTKGIWSVFGLKIDAKRRVLWAVSAAHPQMPSVEASENGLTGFFKFDLQTGRLLKKYVLENKPSARLLGDLMIAPNGDVYASDSLGRGLYVVRQTSETAELFLENEMFASPQGLDFSSDGKFILMADYGRGIFRINVATQEVVKLNFGPEMTLFGIDGIYFYQNSLIAVQNGVRPERIVRLHLSKDLGTVEKFEVLEANNPSFDEITLGTIVKKDFYFIANSQWRILENNDKPLESDKLTDVHILKMNLMTEKR